MVARFSAASLALIAFTIAVVAGLFAGNPVTTTLSRGILALFIFCILGLSLGKIADVVIAEHQKKRETEILERLKEIPTPHADANGATAVRSPGA